MPITNRKRCILLRLFNKNKGKCYYCDCKTTMPKSGQSVLKSNNATIEHLYPKLDLRRYTQGGDKATVLSCYFCNQAYNKVQHQRIVAAYISIHGTKEIDLLEFLTPSQP